jgi:hypothetical protein
MFTTKIDAGSLDMIAQLGDRIAEDVVKLENLIWLVKAESIAQLDAASRAYADAFANNRTTPELASAVQEAALRVTQLEKLWSQEVAMRNRAVQFGDMRGRQTPGWKALEAVMQLALEKSAQ